MDETPELGIRIGTLAVDRRYITLAQLREGLVEQSREASSDVGAPLLGFILVTKGYLTEEQLQSLLDEQQASRPVPAQDRFGKYRILREVGRGGMGVVYEALDTELDRRVALKRLIPHEARDPDAARRDEERFLHEARTSANLPRHPGIVGVYEAGVIGGHRFIAMELIEGREFSEWRKGRGVPLRLQVSALRDTALAVHEAHRKGVIHRDLKPANILVDADGRPHVTDFGLAKAFRESVDVALTMTGRVVGTPAYMSPEQGRAEKAIDARTDVYSLGVMLYEILTDRLPFDGESPMEILVKKASQQAASPSSVARTWVQRTVGNSLDNICMKAMARERKDRYRSAREFAADLTAWIRGDEVKARGPGKPLPKWMLPAGAGAAAAALLVTAIFIMAKAPPGARPKTKEEARERAPAGAPAPALPSAAARPVSGAPLPVQEGERLRILSCTGGRTHRQGTSSAIFEGRWSANEHLFWTGGRPKDRLRLQFHSPVSGRATLVVGFTRSTDYGIFKVSVNRQVVDAALDLYSARILPLEREFPGVTLGAGENEIEFEIVGSNRAAAPLGADSELMQFGLDFVVVRGAKSAYVDR